VKGLGFLVADKKGISLQGSSGISDESEYSQRFHRQPNQPTIFLHVGMHKTASTYIQNRLRRNHDLLLTHGILYPPLRSDHLSLVRAVSDRQFGHWQQWCDRAHQKGLNSLLISAEALSVVLSKCMNEQAHGEWLTSQINDLGWNLQIIAFIRDQPSYLNSRYTQLVKRLHTQSSFKRYVRRVACGGTESECDMNKLFGWLLKPSSPSSIFIPFERSPSSSPGSIIEPCFSLSLQQLDPFDALISCLPLPSDIKFSNISTSASNQQPGDTGVRLARRLGRYLKKNHPQLFNQSSIRIAVREQVECLVTRHQWHQQPFNGLTPSLLKEIRQTYNQSNNAFASATWGVNAWQEIFPSVQTQQKKSVMTLSNLKRYTIKVLKSEPIKLAIGEPPLN
jgi:hypothetical protein